jgi:hypothetical protein
VTILAGTRKALAEVFRVLVYIPPAADEQRTPSGRPR